MKTANVNLVPMFVAIFISLTPTFSILKELEKMGLSVEEQIVITAMIDVVLMLCGVVFSLKFVDIRANKKLWRIRLEHKISQNIFKTVFMIWNNSESSYDYKGERKGNIIASIPDNFKVTEINAMLYNRDGKKEYIKYENFKSTIEINLLELLPNSCVIIEIKHNINSKTTEKIIFSNYGNLELCNKTELDWIYSIPRKLFLALLPFSFIICIIIFLIRINQLNFELYDFILSPFFFVFITSIFINLIIKINSTKIHKKIKAYYKSNFRQKITKR